MERDGVNSDEILSQDLESQNGISTPDESMRSQSDTWSMKSYPINSGKENRSCVSSSGYEKNSNSEENDSMLCPFNHLGEYNCSKSSISHATRACVPSLSKPAPAQEPKMAPPPKRKRKKYPNPGKTSRKRKRKFYKRDGAGKFTSAKS